jgi:hypothetical protein
MTQMKGWVVIMAAAAFLALPVMVSAGEDTRIPPEAQWSPTPPMPGLVEVPQERVVSTAHERASDNPRPAAKQATRGPLSLSAADDEYQRVSRTVHTEGLIPAQHRRARRHEGSPADPSHAPGEETFPSMVSPVRRQGIPTAAPVIRRQAADESPTTRLQRAPL